MKQYIFTTFAQAPEAGVSHPQFYSNYRSLVQCLSYFDDHIAKKSLPKIYESESLEGNKRRKREAIESIEEDNDLIPQQMEAHQREDTKLQPFEMLFMDLYGIVRNSCPSDVAPNPNFLSRGLKEIVEWIHLHNLAMEAKEKYFDKMGILHQVHDCFLEVKGPRKQVW
jgi:hypothetical protein